MDNFFKFRPTKIVGTLRLFDTVKILKPKVIVWSPWTKASPANKQTSMAHT